MANGNPGDPPIQPAPPANQDPAPPAGEGGGERRPVEPPPRRERPQPDRPMQPAQAGGQPPEERRPDEVTPERPSRDRRILGGVIAVLALIAMLVIGWSLLHKEGPPTPHRPPIATAPAPATPTPSTPSPAASPPSTVLTQRDKDCISEMLALYAPAGGISDERATDACIRARR